MPSVFYSWQSDLPNRTNRSFIQDALTRAINNVLNELEVEPADRDETLQLDHDTRGVAGTPSITDTIFQKISDSLVFVPDLSFIAQTGSGRLVPNPNVLIEYGYAVATLGHNRLVPIINTAFGDVTDTSLPFDMRHLRRPITYNLPEDADQDQKAAVRTQLVGQLSAAIHLIVESQGIETQDDAPYTSPWPDNQKEFFGLDNRILVPRSDSMFKPHNQFEVPNNSSVTLRAMPSLPVEPFRYPPEVEQAIEKSRIPLFGGRNHSTESNKYGAVSYSFTGQTQVLAFSQVHLNKEIWSSDYHYLHREYQALNVNNLSFGYVPWRAIYRDVLRLLPAYRNFYNAIQLNQPIRLVFGLFGIEHYRMALDPDYIEQYGGNFFNSDLTIERTMSTDTDLSDLAGSIIKEMFEAFGAPVPSELNAETKQSK